VSPLSPTGAAKARFLEERAGAPNEAVVTDAGDPDDFEAPYLGWEIARCAAGLSSAETRALEALAAACIVAVRAGSTRLPIDPRGLAAAFDPLGAADSIAAARALLEQARSGVACGASAVLGRAGERKPLVVEGEWLYPERMRVLEDGFCARVRERLSRGSPPADARKVNKALSAAASGPPTLTEEQKRAVREGLVAPMALVTGGPGTGKTTIVLALLRAAAWMGTPMEAIAIAAPTGKAARRLEESIASGLAAASTDIGEAALRLGPPVPQTLHRLLGWSPSAGRFGRHENDPLPHGLVIVDEASMVDLAMMDRLVRALARDARLVLLGDADQLPSVEAGAVFRDLCGSLPSVRLTTNLRVAGDEGARRIVTAAAAINAGKIDARFRDAVDERRAVREVSFRGVEHVAMTWSDAGDDLLDRYWRERVASPSLVRRAFRVYRPLDGVFEDADRAELEGLFAEHARTRILCATRVRGIPSSADAINDQMLARLRSVPSPGRPWRADRRSRFAPGTPVMVERNDYERQLFNGDPGVVVRVDDTVTGDGPELMAVFRQGATFRAFPAAGPVLFAPTFAMTVHKAQGSEFDDVVLVLPDTDLPLLTRELLYTAVSRARRSVLIVGPPNLLARATSRAVERHSGVMDKLSESPR
jgi:exodeoxyribonuclease V alpha subunit